MQLDKMMGMQLAHKDTALKELEKTMGVQLAHKDIALKELEKQLAVKDAELQKRVLDLAFHGDYDKYREALLKRDATSISTPGASA